MWLFWLVMAFPITLLACMLWAGIYLALDEMRTESRVYNKNAPLAKIADKIIPVWCWIPKQIHLVWCLYALGLPKDKIKFELN